MPHTVASDDGDDIGEPDALSDQLFELVPHDVYEFDSVPDPDCVIERVPHGDAVKDNDAVPQDVYVFDSVPDPDCVIEPVPHVDAVCETDAVPNAGADDGDGIVEPDVQYDAAEDADAAPLSLAKNDGDDNARVSP